MPAYVTVELVRDHVADTEVLPFSIDMDLEFSDEDITSAMDACAREFNGIPPRGLMGASGSSLPANDNTFLDGTAAFLYRRRLSKLQRGDVEHEAGGVRSKVFGQMIKHTHDNYKEYYEKFITTGRQIKKHVNLLGAYHSF